MKKSEIKIRHDKDVVIVELLDEEIIAEAATNDIAELLFSTVADNLPIRMLLNFSMVRRLGSSMLSTLVLLNRRIKNSGGTIKLCCIRSSLREIFTITKIDDIFDIYKDEEEALHNFGSQAG